MLKNKPNLVHMVFVCTTTTYGKYKYTHSYPRGLGKDLGDKCENSWLFRAHFQSISGEEACDGINMQNLNIFLFV